MIIVTPYERYFPGRRGEARAKPVGKTIAAPRPVQVPTRQGQPRDFTTPARLPPPLPPPRRNATFARPNRTRTMSFESVIQSLVESWGLPAIFLGGVFEGDTAALLGGALAHRGGFPPFHAFLAISSGAALADQALFAVARRHRDAPRLRRLTATAPAARILSLAVRRPVLACMGFRFVWGLRTLGPLALGASTVPARLYIPLNLIAVILWGALFTALGYGAGHLVERVFGRLGLHHHLILLLLLGLAAAVAVALLRHLMRRRRPPD